MKKLEMNRLMKIATSDRPFTKAETKRKSEASEKIFAQIEKDTKSAFKKMKAKKIVSAIVKKAKRRAWRNTINVERVKNIFRFTLATIKATGDVSNKTTTRNVSVINALTKKYKNLYGEQHYKDFRAEASVPLAVDLKCDSAAKKSGIVTNTSYDACCNAMAKACELVQMATAQQGKKS